LLLQSQNLILRLFSLDLRLFKVVNTTKLRALIIKIARIFLETMLFLF